MFFVVEPDGNFNFHQPYHLNSFDDPANQNCQWFPINIYISPDAPKCTLTGSDVNLNEYVIHRQATLVDGFINGCTDGPSYITYQIEAEAEVEHPDPPIDVHGNNSKRKRGCKGARGRQKRSNSRTKWKF